MVVSSELTMVVSSELMVVSSELKNSRIVRVPDGMGQGAAGLPEGVEEV
jgi:hypothetical protein